MDNLIGAVIGRYRVTDLLGEGGMSKVYKAVDTVLERFVAIKVLLPERQGKETFLSRFDREAKVLAQLNHPHIVKVLDYGQYQGMPYLVMEYISVTTLNKKYRTPIPWRQAFQLLLPIIRALESAHRIKVVHRDVKPSNIIINEVDQPMLTDFGVVKILEEEQGQALTMTGVGIGTPAYMSPEQGQGLEVDARSDIYSIGIVLFELITGEKPFVANTAVEVALKHLSESIPSLSTIIKDIPGPVEQLIRKAMAKKPEDRFQSMQALAYSMETILYSDLGDNRNAKRDHRNPSKIWVFILGITLLVIATGTFLLTRSTGYTQDKSTTTTPTTYTESGHLLITPSQVSKINPTQGHESPTQIIEKTPSTFVITPTNPLPTDTGIDGGVIDPKIASRLIEINRLEKISTVTLTWSPNSKWIFVGGSAGIAIINPDTFQQEYFLKTSEVVNSVTVSSNSQILTALTGRSILVWDIGTRKQIGSVNIQGSPMSITFLPDNETLAIATLDGKIYLVKIQTGEVIKTILGNYGGWCVSTSPDGKMIAMGTSQGALLWELPSGAWMPILTGQNDLVKSITFSPDSQYLATGSTDIIRIWEVKTGKEVISITLPSGFGGNINALAFSPDGKILLSGSDDFQLRLWNVEINTLLVTLKAHTSPINSVTFSPNGKYILSGASEGIIRLWGLP